MPNDHAAGRRAYEAYRAARGSKAHDGAPLPDWAAVSAANQQAWASFALGAIAGATAETCYSTHYLNEVRGLAVSGQPAPSFAYFRWNRPEIAGAWNAAWRAARAR